MARGVLCKAPRNSHFEPEVRHGTGFNTPSLTQHHIKSESKMPKLKTHTGAAKRFKKTGTGKIVRHQTKTRHILSSKSPKVKRKLGKSVVVSDGDHAKVARMIPYA